MELVLKLLLPTLLSLSFSLSFIKTGTESLLTH